jgi:hypothetical protein
VSHLDSGVAFEEHGDQKIPLPPLPLDVHQRNLLHRFLHHYGSHYFLVSGWEEECFDSLQVSAGSYLHLKGEDAMGKRSNYFLVEKDFQNAFQNGEGVVEEEQQPQIHSVHCPPDQTLSSKSKEEERKW